MAGEEHVWLTYEEAGKALGIKAASAKRLSFRRHWPHRAGNDGLALVGVPATELHRVTPRDDSGTVTGGTPGDKPDDTAALALALDRIEALAGQAERARAEVTRLRAELAQVARGQAAAEVAAADAQRRADQAEETALEAWRTAADLAARLAASARPSPAPLRRKGVVTRLLGW